jgi:glycine/D-amino acid oxidase-like deaminating enzyme
VRSDVLVNATGPFFGVIADALGISLPVDNVLQQKIAFEDRAGAVPRNAPFAVDLDCQALDWTAKETALLADDPTTAWLTGAMPGGIHCRPDGGADGSWIKLGWAYNSRPQEPDRAPVLEPHFPEIVLRGATRLQPALKAYYGKLPRGYSHYGGYYTMTPENWPLIGPMGPPDAFMVGALSGFGTMAACGAGALCADWISGAALPSYAKSLGLERYDDVALMRLLAAQDSRGIL